MMDPRSGAGQRGVGVAVKSLGQLEREVLPLFAAGRSYKEIAEELGRNIKSIDNAIQRLRTKGELQARRHRRKGSAHA